MAAAVRSEPPGRPRLSRFAGRLADRVLGSFRPIAQAAWDPRCRQRRPTLFSARTRDPPDTRAGSRLRARPHPPHPPNPPRPARCPSAVPGPDLAPGSSPVRVLGGQHAARPGALQPGSPPRWSPGTRHRPRCREHCHVFGRRFCWPGGHLPDPGCAEPSPPSCTTAGMRSRPSSALAVRLRSGKFLRRNGLESQSPGQLCRDYCRDYRVVSSSDAPIPTVCAGSLSGPEECAS